MAGTVLGISKAAALALFNSVQQALNAHLNNNDAHGLDVLKGRVTTIEQGAEIWNVVATDTFTGADATLTGQQTSTGGYYWVKAGWASDLRRASNAAAGATPDAASAAFLSATSGGAMATFTDIAVTADLGQQAWIYARVNGAQGYLVARSDISVVLYVNGSSGLVTLLSVPYTGGSNVTVSLVCKGSTLSLYVGGVKQGSVVDSTFASGAVGLRIDKASSTIDNFRLATKAVL